MKKYLMSFFLGLTLLFSEACSHSIHLVHVGDFSPAANKSKGKLISAVEKQGAILGMVDNTHYVDTAVKKLENACPKGVITGITSQFSTSHGFFSWTNKILLQGLCRI